MAEIIAAKRGEIEDGKAKLVEVNGSQIALFNCKGKYYAIGSTCAHRGGPLAEGDLDDDCIVTCPWHMWTYDIRTGESTMMPGAKVPTYEVVIDGDNIKIRS